MTKTEIVLLFLLKNEIFCDGCLEELIGSIPEEEEEKKDFFKENKVKPISLAKSKNEELQCSECEANNNEDESEEEDKSEEESDQDDTGLAEEIGGVTVDKLTDLHPRYRAGNVVTEDTETSEEEEEEDLGEIPESEINKIAKIALIAGKRELKDPEAFKEEKLSKEERIAQERARYEALSQEEKDALAAEDASLEERAKAEGVSLKLTKAELKQLAKEDEPAQQTEEIDQDSEALEIDLD